MKLSDVGYNEAGELVWLQTKGRAIQGTPVGWISKHGYREMEIDGKRKKVHHVVWFLNKGEWPDVLDHINGDRSDNRIENLRTCTVRQNSSNRKKKDRYLPRNVYRAATEGKYRVSLQVEGKHISFGVFSDLETANTVAEQARELHYGAFAGS